VGDLHRIDTIRDAMEGASMVFSVPVMEAARGEARDATGSATSLGRTGRPKGFHPVHLLKPSVRVNPVSTSLAVLSEKLCEESLTGVRFHPLPVGEFERSLGSGP
jgi:hypothetical protein